jgi:hypothetical protein
MISFPETLSLASNKEIVILIQKLALSFLFPDA